MKRVFCLAILIVLLAGVAGASNHAGLARLNLTPTRSDGSIDGVATFGGAMPDSARLDALRALGLQVQGLSNLPLALMLEPRTAIKTAVNQHVTDDVYPNDKLVYYSVASNTTMRVNEVQALGINGAGVDVAIVDSGIDATHPDLARRVIRNIKMIVADAGVVNAGDIVIPMDQTPYNDSDTSSGHGTHVAGIVAADNTDGQVLGVAPGASLIGYGMGDAVFVFSALSAFNDILKNQSTYPVRVVNNSWGSSFRLFDPDDPTMQATKALHDAGIVVCFAAGNET